MSSLQGGTGVPDIRNLETRLGKDKAYSRASDFTDKERSMGFVCPRANAYGGREGIVPPGVAAVHGLVPRGMRHIKPGDVARHANEARDEGRTDVEQYREYYAQGAEAQRKAEAEVEAEAAARRAPSVPPVASVTPAVVARPAPSMPSMPSMPSVPPAPVARKAPPKARARKTSAAASAGRARRLSSLVAPSVSPFPPPGGTPESPVSGDPDDNRMFSQYPDVPPDDNTLDGFYEGLRRDPPGTGRGPGEAAGNMVSVAGDVAPGGPQPGEGRAYPAASPAHGDASPQPAAPSDSVSVAAIASLVAERDQLRRMANDLSGEVGRLREMLEGYAGVEQALAAEREARKSAEAAVPPPAETVRVVLSEQEQKLKVGGRGWECNIMGALHFGRSGASAVLAVLDPAYGSELIASLQAAESGSVVVLSAAARTYCTYAGHCVKIYGDADSPDFITLVWLNVDRGAHSE